MGDPINAERALQIGLVTRIVESEVLLSEVEKMAAHLATFAPFVPHFMKLMVNKGMEASLVGALAMEKLGQGALLMTEDSREGITSFLNKTTPRFKGK